jgi:mannosyltransferase OCH1-like enzyme
MTGLPRLSLSLACLLLSSLLIQSILSVHITTAPFSQLPVIPSILPVLNSNVSYVHHIPRTLWIAVKDRNDPLPPHLKELFDRNPTWTVRICDNVCKDEFMANEFFNTSVSAVYHIINPLVGAARADVWRYAVLFTYGGVYLDDDSDIRVPLDEVS